MGSTIEGDAYHAGTETFRTIVLPSSCILDANVAAGAAIATSKMLHRHFWHFHQDGSAASITIPVHEVHGATGSIVALKCGSVVVAIGAATVTIDLLKNGVSILTAALVLDSSNTIRVLEAAAIATAALVDGNWLDLQITAAAGGGTLPTDMLYELIWDEDPS